MVCLLQVCVRSAPLHVMHSHMFFQEIAPFEIKSKKGPQVISTDEHPKPATTLEVRGEAPAHFARVLADVLHRRDCPNSLPSSRKTEPSMPATHLAFAMEQGRWCWRVRRPSRSTASPPWRASLVRWMVLQLLLSSNPSFLPIIRMAL
jgi:hypothetical protein